MPMLIVAALFVIVPFMFWYGTWFGRELRDNEIDQYLSDTKNACKVQNALNEVEKRIERGDKQIKRVYPKIIALVDDPSAQVRNLIEGVPKTITVDDGEIREVSRLERLDEFVEGPAVKEGIAGAEGMEFHFRLLE